MASSPYAHGIDGLNVRVSRRSLIALAALVLVCGGLALLVAGWIAALTVGHGELARADARLAREVRSAAAVISAQIAAADARAGSLATSRQLQRAVVRHDRHAAAVVTRGRGNVLVYAGSKLLAGRPRFPAIPRSVAVSAKGKMLGRVVGIVPLDRVALDHIAANAGVRSPDRLFVRMGETAGPLGRAFDRRTDRRYRAFGVRIVESPRPVALEVQTPRSAINDRARRRSLWVVLATLASLATAVLAIAGARALIQTRMRQVPRRRDVRQVLELVGDALASTHNPVKLVPVILHAAMEATGAAAGAAIRDGEVVAREGVPEEDGGEPLRLQLSDAEEAGEDVALVLHPPSGGFDGRMVVLAETLRTQASVALENARLHQIVQLQAVTDELTGLANRRSFRESLETELLRAERFENPLSVIVADLDDFKLVNDQFGHQAGDEVLKAFAEVLRGRVRGVDLAARLGGEEFAVLLPETDADGAEALAESLRVAIAELVVPVDSSETRVTASFGVASFPQTHSADELLNAADSALYRAKRQGKDRVVSAAPGGT